LLQVGGAQGQPGAPVALIGPGTGLGVSGLLPAPQGGRLVPIAGEGGHATLAATNGREEAVIDELRRRYGHVSAERAISGPGLVNLYQALCTLDGAAPRLSDAPAISDAALARSDTQAVEALAIFLSLLGT